jgi:hypothetical protein
VTNPDIGNENLPHSNICAAAHRVVAMIPMVEITNDTDQPGIGRPDREMDSARSLMVNDMRAKLVKQPQVRSFRDQEVIGRAQHWPETISIGNPPIVRACGAVIFNRLTRAFDLAFEQAAIVHAGELPEAFSYKVMGLSGLCTWQNRARKYAAWPVMQTQQSEGIGVRPFQQCSNSLPRWLHQTLNFPDILRIFGDGAIG